MCETRTVPLIVQRVRGTRVPSRCQRCTYTVNVCYTERRTCASALQAEPYHRCTPRRCTRQWIRPYCDKLSNIRSRRMLGLLPVRCLFQKRNTGYSASRISLIWVRPTIVLRTTGYNSHPLTPIATLRLCQKHTGIRAWHGAVFLFRRNALYLRHRITRRRNDLRLSYSYRRDPGSRPHVLAIWLTIDPGRHVRGLYTTRAPVGPGNTLAGRARTHRGTRRHTRP